MIRIFAIFGTLGLLLTACAASTTDDGSTEPGDTENIGQDQAPLLPGGVWRWTSDEFPPAVCPAGSVIDRMQCTGNNCDNVGLRCAPLGRTAFAGGFNPFISEEAPNNTFTCPSGQFIVALECTGNDCDNVSVQCASFSNVGRGPLANCGWTAWFSEEQQNSPFLPQNFAAAGIRCRGNNCDDMAILGCPLLGVNP